MIFQFLIQTSPDIISTSTTPDWMWIVVLILIVITLIALGLGIRKIIRLFQQPELEGLNRKKILEIWHEIEKTAAQSQMGGKMAIIEADKLLDKVLRSMFMPGETLGERLKAAAYKYPNIRKVWGAHRLRNQLVHDTSFEISSRQIKSALHDFQSALKTLNVM
ncbi:MAG: hypothetical protein Q7N87_00385 [Candidatus Uhrbacteria bacterium]|nr:hypothetical protein [Candidatus Uhrbacteria bacterium]